MKKIIFFIEKIIDNTTKNNTIYTAIGDELNDFNNDKVQFERPVRGISKRDSRREETDGTKRKCSNYDRRISRKFSSKVITTRKEENIQKQGLNQEIFMNYCVFWNKQRGFL